MIKPTKKEQMYLDIYNIKGIAKDITNQLGSIKLRRNNQ
jgi:hypothetical protein